jgi:ABC-2 type transport system permease protein
MPVFKGYLKIVRANLGVVISYTVVFLIISVMITRMMPESRKDSFRMTKQNITVVDEDNSALSKALVSFLKKTNHVTESGMNRTELSRKLYARSTEYILRIPYGFGSRFTDGSVKLDATKVPGSGAGYYLDACISQFTRTAAAFSRSGYSEEEAAKLTLRASDVSPEVKIADTGKVTEENRPNYAYLFGYFPYLYLSLMICCISYVMIAFSDREIRRRMTASPVSPTAQTLQAVAAFALLFLAFWFISLLLPLAVRSRDFYSAPLAGYYVLNSFTLLIDSVAIGFLVGTLVHSLEAISALANIIGLGMCFLCGVFVPMDLLSTGVRRAASFMPIYWYERTNNLLAENTVLSSANRGAVLQSAGIQLAYALAILAVTLFIARKMRREV